MQTDGSHLRKLSPLPGEYAHPSFSPDNSKIVFSLYSSASQSPGQVYVMDADGSHARRLTGPLGYNGEPYFIPSGRIVYTHHAPILGDRSNDAQTYIMDADGSNKKLFRVFLPGGVRGLGLSQLDEIAISAQGQLAFRIPNSELFIASADGRQLKPVQAPPRSAPESPAWNPNGTRLAYIAHTPHARAGVFVVSADGHQTSQLPSPSDSWIEDLAWSHGGARLAYLSFSSVDGRFTDGGIYVVDVESMQSSRVLAMDFRKAWPWPELHDLSFSPDDRSLVFSANLDGNLQIYAVDIGGGRRRLTKPPSENHSPSFTH